MIYDNYFDDALELCNSYLKSSNSPTLKAAKCYILVELGEVYEASFLSKSLLNGKPITDKQTLGLLDRVFMKVEDHLSSYKMLESSFKQTKSEELGNWWFMASLRSINADDGRSLLRVGMTIFAHHKKVIYQFWIILSLIIMDIAILPPSPSPSPNMKLAHKYVLQIIAENKKHSKCDVELMLLVLERNHDYKTSLSLVHDAKDIPYYNNIVSTLLLKSGKNNDLIILLKEEFSKNGILDFKLWEIIIEVLDYKSSIELLLSTSADKRTFHLAKIKLEIKHSTTQILSSLIEYLEFGKEKPFCFLDFKSLINTFREDGKVEVLDGLFQYCKERNSLIFVKIQREINPNFHNYLDSLSSLIKDSEALLNMAICSIDKEISLNSLIVCIPLLEKVILKDNGNYIAKFLLMLVWIRLGMMKEAMECFSSLDIKQIQLDTLSHFISEYLVELGIFMDEIVESFYNRAIRFYMENIHNSHRVLGDSLSKNQLLTLSNIFDFNNRLLFSIQRFSSISSLMRIALLKLDYREIKDFLKDYEVEDLPIGFEKKIKDNRDFGIISFIGCRKDINVEADSFLIEDYLFIRNCIIMLKSLCSDDSFKNDDEDLLSLFGCNDGFRLSFSYREWNSSLLKEAFSFIEKNHYISLLLSFKGQSSDILVSIIKDNIDCINSSILAMESLYDESLLHRSIKKSWIDSLERMINISLFDLSILNN